MPIMPRTSGKCQKIAEDILGKKPKKTTPSGKTKKEKQLEFEESSKAK